MPVLGKRFATLPRRRAFLSRGNYASGTKNPAGRTWNTFHQIYPSNHDKYGFADQVGRRNLVQFRVGVEEEPTKRWKLKQAFEGYWLATSNDNFYASSGAIAVPARPGASRHIGDELDLVAEYQLNKGLSFGFGYARLFAGHFLKTTTFGHDYSYPYTYFEYNFLQSGFHFPISPNKNPGRKITANSSNTSSRTSVFAYLIMHRLASMRHPVPAIEKAAERLHNPRLTWIQPRGSKPQPCFFEHGTRNTKRPASSAWWRLQLVRMKASSL